MESDELKITLGTFKKKHWRIDREIGRKPLHKLQVSEEKKDFIYENDVKATIKFSKDDLAFGRKWKIPLHERQRNISLYGTWIFPDNVTVIPERHWPRIEDLDKSVFDRLGTIDLDNPLNYTPIFMPEEFQKRPTPH